MSDTRRFSARRVTRLFRRGAVRLKPAPMGALERVGTFDPAVEHLTEWEALALGELELFRLAAALLGPSRAMLRRIRRDGGVRDWEGPGHTPRRQGGRQFRRHLATMAPEGAQTVRALLDRELGRTGRPVDPLSDLCQRLRDHAGLTATEIVALLDATGLETAVGDAANKVMRRVERARRRQVTTGLPLQGVSSGAAA